jgi:hypothetical protein
METTTATTDSNMIEGSKGDNRFVLSSCKRLKTCDSASCNPTKDNDAMTPSIIHIPPLPSTDASSSDILSSTIAKETTQIPTLENIPSELFIQYILPFVGRHQYLFVAAVNHHFHAAYLTVFPKKVTRFNVSTIEHAKICYDDFMNLSSVQHILCYTAAREGNLSVLKYLRSLGCAWDNETCSNAAINGHLDVVKWCHENGWPWDKYTCAHAAENGHLDVIKWCRENGFPWDALTCYYAAENGHIDILKWCRQNGCEWWQSTCEDLESKGCFDVLQWSFENGCKCKVCSKYGNLD